MENERPVKPALDIPLELEALEPEDSPCQLICSIDKDSNMCFGCGRTPEEIADWPLRSEVDRKRILSELPERMPPLRVKLAERRSRRRVNKRRRAESPSGTKSA